MFHYESPETSSYSMSYSLWDHFLAIWKFDTLIVIDKSGIYPKRKHTYSTLEEAITAYPDARFVAFEEDGETRLRDFVHPADNIIYIIGDNYWRGTSNMPEGIPKIRIDTPVDCMTRPLWDITAATCLAYDRSVKLDLGMGILGMGR